MRRDIYPATPQPAVAEQVIARVHVESGRERVKVALETRALGPAFEPDADLIGRVAGRHPFRLGNADLVEEPAEGLGADAAAAHSRIFSI